MAFDGLFTISMTTELQQLVTGRISKIHQPNAQEILMQIRAQGKNYKLLFSVHPSYSRVQITNETIDNPATPPLFCMVLRKHIRRWSHYLPFVSTKQIVLSSSKFKVKTKLEMILQEKSIWKLWDVIVTYY